MIEDENNKIIMFDRHFHFQFAQNCVITTEVLKRFSQAIKA